MKKHFFCVIALLLVVVTSLAVSGCKKEVLTIKRQWLLLDGEYIILQERIFYYCRAKEGVG